MIQGKTLASNATELSGYLRVFRSQRNSSADAVKEAEKIQNDIMHRLESPDCQYKERARLATQLASLRRERREHKDWMCATNELASWLESEKGKKLESLMGEFVGVARRARATHQSAK